MDSRNKRKTSHGSSHSQRHSSSPESHYSNDNTSSPREYDRQHMNYQENDRHRRRDDNKNVHVQNNKFRDDYHHDLVKNFENHRLDNNDDLESDLFNQNEVTQGINFKLYEKSPVECSGKNPPPPIESFSRSGLHKILLNNIELCNYNKPTPVQKYAISCVLAKRDLMGCAQTGSGKTAAFLLPIVDQLIRNQEQTYSSPSSSSTCYPLVLILAPTRELSIQIHQQARKFTHKTGMRSVVVYGGANPRGQQEELDRGATILVATPGRLSDFMKRGIVSMEKILFLVLDEADRMLDMGFMPQVQRIVDKSDMPKKGSRHTMMFSATFPREIQTLAQSFLSDYIFLAVGRVGSTTEFITQQLRHVENHAKMSELLDLISECEGLKLIFVETRKAADRVEEELIGKGLDAIAIHGDRIQSEREHAIEMFRSGRIQILVATDVAARGLDIPNVMWVINYDLPSNIDSYVHRIGRTGRCGNNGNAISFINENNRSLFSDLQIILKETKQEIPQWFTELSSKCSDEQKPYRHYQNNSYRNSYDSSYRNFYGGFGGRDVRRNRKNYDNYNNNDNNTNHDNSSPFKYNSYRSNHENEPQNYNDEEYNK